MASSGLPVEPNVYWLGLDKNVIPPASQPPYSKFNATYPTHGRIVEVMIIYFSDNRSQNNRLDVIKSAL
jgi:hypothetical protein